MNPELLLRNMFARAVEVARPTHVVPNFLPAPPVGRTIVLGAGKGAAAMAAALEAQWEGPLEGLVVTRYGHGVPCQRIEVAEAGHPLPDEAGAAASARILALAEAAGEVDLVIVLISGGGSALLTLPGDGVSVAEMAALTEGLLASGARISQMNCIRRHLSRINGGRLAAAAHPARVVTLVISDVPGDDPADISSGPTVGDATTVADARFLLQGLRLGLEADLLERLGAALGESVKPGDPRLARAECHVIATASASLAAAAEVARAAGCDAFDLGDRIEGEAVEVGARMGREALAMKARRGGERPLVVISGGETTVTLPKRPYPGLGSGGRNVEFLMGMLEVLEGAKGIYAIACDTDGIDGGAEVAGAVIGPDTLAAGERNGMLFRGCLARHDGHGFFEAAGCQVVTGPTHTNVNDFRAVLILPG